MLMTFANGIQPMSAGFFYLHWKSPAWCDHVPHKAGALPAAADRHLPGLLRIDGVMYAGPIADTSAFVLAVVFARRELGVMKAAEQNA